MNSRRFICPARLRMGTAARPHDLLSLYFFYFLFVPLSTALFFRSPPFSENLLLGKYSPCVVYCWSH
jgi:hypothetical protein